MQSNIDRYSKLLGTPLSEEKISAYIPKPTELDYNRGYIKRYFVQKTNDKGSPIYEIEVTDKTFFDSNPLYTVVELKWRIKGPLKPKYNEVGNILDKSVSESNRIAIKLVSDKIPNLKLYLPNLIQFYK